MRPEGIPLLRQAAATYVVSSSFSTLLLCCKFRQVLSQFIDLRGKQRRSQRLGFLEPLPGLAGLVPGGGDHARVQEEPAVLGTFGERSRHRDLCFGGASGCDQAPRQRIEREDVGTRLQLTL